MTYGQYLKAAITQAFQEILLSSEHNNTDKVLRVVDVGFNIGWFTNLAASLGHHVDVFEPNIVNGTRICQSIELNQYPSGIPEQKIPEFHHGSVNYYPFAVSNVNSGIEDLYIPPLDYKNPGMATLAIPDYKELYSVVPIQVLSLDQFAKDKNWFSSCTKIPILKIDVEGYEDKVLMGSRQVLKTLVDHVFIKKTSTLSTKRMQGMFQLLLESQFHLHATGTWMGPGDLHRGPKSNATDWLVDKIRQEKTPISHVWWKRRVEQ